MSAFSKYAAGISALSFGTTSSIVTATPAESQSDPAPFGTVTVKSDSGTRAIRLVDIRAAVPSQTRKSRTTSKQRHQVCDLCKLTSLRCPRVDADDPCERCSNLKLRCTTTWKSGGSKKRRPRGASGRLSQQPQSSSLDPRSNPVSSLALETPHLSPSRAEARAQMPMDQDYVPTASPYTWVPDSCPTVFKRVSSSLSARSQNPEWRSVSSEARGPVIVTQPLGLSSAQIISPGPLNDSLEAAWDSGYSTLGFLAAPSVTGWAEAGATGIAAQAPGEALAMSPSGLGVTDFPNMAEQSPMLLPDDPVDYSGPFVADRSRYGTAQVPTHTYTGVHVSTTRYRLPVSPSPGCLEKGRLV
jgi:hypothetical protein